MIIWKLSRVACLLDELDGKPINSSHWNGYHPAADNPALKGDAADGMVSEPCYRLQSLDVTTYSLEMQIWWRDHQAADKARVEHELARIKNEQEKVAAVLN